MNERRYRIFLTPESHYEMVIRADRLLHDLPVDGDDDYVVTEEHKKIIKMFAYHRMTAPEIARTGKIIGKRGTMGEDMIRYWINHYFPNLKYEKVFNKNSKRSHDYNHIQRCVNAKKKLMKEAPYCVICGSTKNLELDHILTVSAGGTDDISNLQLLCHKCHCEKTRQEDEQFGWTKAGLKKGRAEHQRRKLSA